MPRKIKLSKIAIVAFLTVLIWVWADLALDDTHLVPNVSISIVRSSNPSLWATFPKEGEPPVLSIALKHIVLKGPNSKIAEIKREQSNATLKLDFPLNPELQGMTTAGTHKLPVLEFLKKRSGDIGRLTGLTVESCEPNTLTVNVEIFAKSSLAVKCFDDRGISRDVQSITPETVEMYVPADWGRPAKIELTPVEIQQARLEAVEKIPFVVLPGGQKRYANERVKVKMSPEADRLQALKVTGVKVSFCFSPITQGKYRVVLENGNEVLSDIDIRATQQAKEDYEALSFQTRLEIYDNDAESTDTVSRRLKYNFPIEHVSNGDIKLAQDPVEAKFKLVPVTGGGS